MEPDGDTCNHGLQHHIYPLFKVGYWVCFFGAFGFLLHKSRRFTTYTACVAAYAVGPILIVHQVSARGFPPSFAHSPQIANRNNFIFFLARRTKNSQALNVVTNKNPMSDSYPFTTWWFQPIPNILVLLDHETPKDRGENFKTYLKLTTT